MGTTVQVGRDFAVYYATGSKIHGLCSHKFASGTQVGLVGNLSYTVEQNVDQYFAAGRRMPWGVKPGRYAVTATLETLWLDSGAQAFLLGQSLATGSLTAFALGFSGTEKGCILSGCKVGTYDIEIDAEGWATATVDVPAIVVI